MHLPAAMLRIGVMILLGVALCGGAPSLAACVTSIPAAKAGTSAKCEFKEGELTAIVASECTAAALLIGVGAYQENWGELANSVSDIRRIGHALPSTFSQVRAENCSAADLRSAIHEFVASSKKVDVAFVYISAHGFEYGGQNYIVPITTATPGGWTINKSYLTDDFKVFLETNFINISSFIPNILPKKYSLIFLDACREDPLKAATNVAKFSSSSVIDNGGQLIVYSTLPTYISYNAVPSGTSPGPFASAFAKRLTTPHNSIEDIIAGLTAEVEDRTAKLNPKQRPFTSGSSRVKFYFRAGVTVGSPSPLKQNDVKQALGGRDQTLSSFLTLQITDQELRLLDGAVLADLATQRHKIAELEMLANNGLGDAAYLLGFLYHYGVGVAADRKGAKRWLEASVKLDSAAGKTSLAYILASEGKAGRRRAADLFEQASAVGFPRAKANLGYALVRGTLGPRDERRGWELISSAAEDGYIWAIKTLAKRPNANESRKRAIVLMQNLANENNADAANWLCMTFAAEQSFSQAFPVCRAGAESDQTASQGYLAILYANGWGVTKSIVDARFWKNIVRAKAYEKDLPKVTAKWLRTELAKVSDNTVN